MQGIITWFNAEKRSGVIEVLQDGIVQKYFLLLSRVSRSPQIIKVGQFVRFETFSPAPKSWLLPIAQGIEISNVPFPDAGVAALQSTPPLKAGE